MAEIDITDLVGALESAFVSWGVDFLFALTVAQPYLSWVAWPFFSQVYRMILKYLLSWLAASAEMAGFFLNTALKKSGQAKDFVDAVKFVQSLPKDVSEEAYAKAEKAQIAAFNALVRVT